MREGCRVEQLAFMAAVKMEQNIKCSYLWKIATARAICPDRYEVSCKQELRYFRRQKRRTYVRTPMVLSVGKFVAVPLYEVISSPD